MKYLITIILVAAFTLGFSQQKLDYDQPAIVQLKDGSKFEGVILEWQYGEDLLLKTKWNLEMRIPANVIKRVNEMNLKNWHIVKDGEVIELMKIPKIYNYKEQGRYYAADLSLIGPNQGARGDGVPGMAISVSAGEKINRFFSYGLGIGYDNYTFDAGERLIPVFAETRGYLHETNQAFYYKLKVGYGFAFKDLDYTIVSATGGLMAHPSIGYRFGHRATKFTLDLGYKFQNANFVYENSWRTSDQKITYRRLTLGFGILL